MKMTAEEIVKIYKADPSRETMLQLARDNECTLKDIGEFLKDAATPKKKPGRPKGSGRGKKTPKNEVCDTTKKDKNKKVVLKVDSATQEMRAEETSKKEIPEEIKTILLDRYNILEARAETHMIALRAINEEQKAISSFLWGE